MDGVRSAPTRRGGLLLFGRLPRIASAVADFIRGYFRPLPTGGRAAFDPSMRQAESSVPMKYVHAIAGLLMASTVYRGRSSRNRDAQSRPGSVQASCPALIRVAYGLYCLSRSIFS